uniref:LRRCT domain-containing protein n=1 Tax=Acrobeloides nanus TaxID=290746 RepID=A0A914DV47_9BILA
MQFGSIVTLLAVFLILAQTFEYDTEYDIGELITCEEDCKCDHTEPSTITCDKVKFEEEDLTTANLKLMDKSAIYKVVKLTNNRIKMLNKKQIVPQLAKNVEELDFSDNLIRAIDDKAFDDFAKLKVLKLSDNHLDFEDMENVFTSKLGKSLDRLYLDHNKQLNDVPKGFFDGLTNLKTLVLDGNVNLELTDKTFGKGMKNLEELSLDDCNISDLPLGIFDGLPKLQRLSLRGNPFTKIPDAINKIKNLKILDLSETSITEMTENSLSNDHSIQHLIMQNLEYLTMIDNCAFCGLQELKVIDFSDCKHLFSINDNAFGSKSKQTPPKLEEVHFDNCNLSTLHEDLANWEDLKKLSIGGNPLNCDCNLKWLLDNPHLQTFNGVTPTCAQPESLKDMPLNKVNDKVCPQAKINTGIFSEPKKRKCLSFVALVLAITFVVLVLVAIFGFIQYTRRRGRLTNVFYRPELPQMSYNKLPTNPDLMSKSYTYSIQQEKA